MASNGALIRKGSTLDASGTLDRAAATLLWPQLNALLDGADTLDLRAVERLDSAGLALLSEAITRIRNTGKNPHVIGTPPGLVELRAAYRLSPFLDFQTSKPETI